MSLAWGKKTKMFCQASRLLKFSGVQFILNLDNVLIDPIFECCYTSVDRGEVCSETWERSPGKNANEFKLTGAWIVLDDWSARVSTTDASAAIQWSNADVSVVEWIASWEKSLVYFEAAIKWDDIDGEGLEDVGENSFRPGND
jgi:hypothetical protein